MEEMIYGAPLSPRVVSVKPTDNYELELTFNNGEVKLFDAHELLSLKVFAPLNNPSFFKTAKVSYGTVVWPSDIDLCADTLYEQSVVLN